MLFWGGCRKQGADGGAWMQGTAWPAGAGSGLPGSKTQRQPPTDGDGVVKGGMRGAWGEKQWWEGVLEGGV